MERVQRPAVMERVQPDGNSRETRQAGPAEFRETQRKCPGKLAMERVHAAYSQMATLGKLANWSGSSGSQMELSGNSQYRNVQLQMYHIYQCIVTTIDGIWGMAMGVAVGAAEVLGGGAFMRRRWCLRATTVDLFPLSSPVCPPSIWSSSSGRTSFTTFFLDIGTRHQLVRARIQDRWRHEAFLDVEHLDEISCPRQRNLDITWRTHCRVFATLADERKSRRWYLCRSALSDPESA